MDVEASEPQWFEAWATTGRGSGYWVPAFAGMTTREGECPAW